MFPNHEKGLKSGCVVIGLTRTEGHTILRGVACGRSIINVRISGLCGRRNIKVQKFGVVYVKCGPSNSVYVNLHHSGTQLLPGKC